MRRTLPARYPIAVTVVALALALTGCAGSNGSNESTGDTAGFDKDGCSTSGSASDSVKVTGDFGDKPKVEFSKDLTVENTQRTVVIEGKGDPAELGSQLSIDLALYDVATQKEVVPYTDAPQSFKLDRTQVLTGIVDVLNCAREGDRIVGVVPASRAFGSTGQTDIGVGPDATLLFIVDVAKVTAPVKPAEWTENVPTVTRDDKGIPTVALPKTDAPTALQLTVLTEGDGAVVARGDSVTVNYQGISWDTKKIFDESFTKTPATFSTGGVIPGFEAALVGQKVGSTVMVVIPPELAYGTDPDAHELGGQTLVFLVDIKDTAAPAN